MDGEALGGMSHLLVAYLFRGDALERVYPAVAHTVGKLLLLPPGYLLGQEVGKGLAKYLLFYLLSRAHLGLGIEPHGYVEEVAVEEGHSSLHAPSRQRLVGTQAVIPVQLAQLAHRLLVEGACRRSLVEIQVASENLVGTLTREHHLDAHALDDTCQQVHRGGSAHGGHVVSLCEIDYIPQRIKPLLDGVVDFVVHGAYMLGHQTCLLQVGRSLETHGKGVQAWPPGTRLSAVLHSARSEFLCYGADDAAVQSAAQQHSIGHVAHQLALDGLLQAHTQTVDVGSVVLYCLIVHPVAGVPAAHHTLAAIQIVAGQEGLILVAETLESLQFTGYIGLAVGIMAYI